MSPDRIALLTLSLYLVVAAAVLIKQVIQCGSFMVWALTRIMRAYTILMFSHRIARRCPLPLDGPAIVIANHRSPVDPVLVYSSSLMKEEGYRIRLIEFMTAREYCEIPGMIGWFTRIARCLPVKRDGQDMASAKEALRRLREGRLIGIFPEGRINTQTGLLPFNPGVSWLALRANVPVYPAFIHNAPQQESMVACFFTRQKAKVTFGPAIDLSAWSGKRLTAETLEEVAVHLRQELARVGGIDIASASPVRLLEEPTRSTA